MYICFLIFVLEVPTRMEAHLFRIRASIIAVLIDSNHGNKRNYIEYLLTPLNLQVQFWLTAQNILNSN